MDEQDAPAQQPASRLVQPGINDVVLGHLLQITRDRVQPEPSSLRDVRGADSPRCGEQPA
jgi:hypothetical protein